MSHLETDAETEPETHADDGSGGAPEVVGTGTNG
jgi:hypothetical protein